MVSQFPPPASVPPPVSPPSRPSRRRLIIGAAAVLATLIIAGGVAAAMAGGGSPSTAGTPVASATTSGPPSPSAAASPSPSPSPTAHVPAYRADTDLCGKVPFKPLGDWVSGTPQLLYGHPIKDGTGVPGAYEIRCEFVTYGTYPATVTVIPQIYSGADGARAAFTSRMTGDTQVVAPSLGGYGERAYGAYYTGTDATGLFTSGYRLVAQADNLVLVVDVMVHRPAGAPQSAMLPRVGAETKAVLPLIPRQ